VTALFTEARGIAGRILEQLRVLAHGIHPTILTNAGLGPALVSYAGSLDSPPSLTVELPQRLPPESEASIYAIVTALVAADAEGSAMSYSIRAEGDVIRIVVDGALDVPDHVLDRLAAAGGTWTEGQTGPEFVLPCG
jgi:hypothetical protein